MTFLVDANFFIEAHRVTYPFDVVPSFWSKIAKAAHRGDICSIDKVKAEIYKHEDELKEWCEVHLPDNFFKDSTTIINTYREVALWANSRKDQYRPEALAVFLDAERADAWLVAYASENSMIVVTQEVSAPDSKKNIKLPDACIDQIVPYNNTIEMLRALKIRI